MDFKIIWTNGAINKLEEILNYLAENWTQREVNNFKNKLSNQIRLIQQFLQMFPISLYNQRLREAVLSKQTTLFYEIKGKKIYVIFLFANNKNIHRIGQK